ncbi:MAG: IS21 family transposase [Proteobacteria bacterium]|nr:IS21 family transposase [Pseudomonadota bacterium]
MSAIKSDMDRKTARKYIKAKKLPSEIKQPHTWRTRENPLADVEGELKSMLYLNKDFEAKSALDYLHETYPNMFSDKCLRTIQRRFKEWKMEFDHTKEIFFPQDNIPGNIMELDWTSMDKLNITINGLKFSHKLCHCVLPYSAWECAIICNSESFLSLKKMFQTAVQKIGKVPRYLKTDNSSTATHRVCRNSKDRAFNSSYLSFCEHFGVTPKTINIRKPHENGTIESLNGHLKNRIKQSLILRGHNDFSSIEEYSNFLEVVIEKANQTRQEKFYIEIEKMKQLPPILLPEYEELDCQVAKSGTVRIKKITYSVPNKYVGRKLRAHIFETEIHVFHNNKFEFVIKRQTGDRGANIDYRHIVSNLLRKPGAFANYKYRSFMFPSNVFKSLYSALNDKYGDRRGEREYLEILNLAATEGETKVARIVTDSIEQKLNLSFEAVKDKLNLKVKVPNLNDIVPDLLIYDQTFLSNGGVSYAR